MNKSNFFQMGKVHPQALLSSTCCFSSKQEVFTVWMKSLVLGGKGCTVFDSNGQIVYRVDNYNRKRNDEVCVMDFRGKVLFTILRKKFNLLQRWEGYRSDSTELSKRKPWFQVRKAFGFLRRDSPCLAVVGLDNNQPYHYKIETWTSKSTCRIADKLGVLVAEVKRKRSTGGFVLGDDVLTMAVEPQVDHSLVMGLVVGYSLINRRL